MTLAPVREIRGVRVPTMFYGTAWKEERTQALTTMALANGFRAIDTANQRKHYFEAAVGRGVQEWLAQSGHERNDVFIQSKFTHRAGHDARLPYDPKAPVGEQVEQSLRSTLDHFGCEYLDSLLLHGPNSRVGLAKEDWDAWHSMESLCKQGKTRLIGASNVTVKQLELLWQQSSVKPAFVQNRCYASTSWDQEVRHFASAHGIGYQGFSLLTANPREVRSKPVAEIAARHRVSPEVIALRAALELGLFVLTGTADPKHQEDDLACPTIALDSDELETVRHVFASDSGRARRMA